MKAGQNSQPLPLAKVAQFNESDEGGLNLGQVLGAIRRRVILVIGVTAVMAAAGGFKALKETPIYQAKFEILTKPLTVESEVVSSVPQTLGNQRGELTGSTKGGVNETKIRVLQSPKVLSPIVEQLKTRYPNITYDTVAGSLSIKNSEKATDILEVGYQSPDPNLVKDVLALVSKAFLNYSLEERQIDIRRGLKFVEEQLPKLQSRVQTQQERLQRIRQNNNLINPEQTGTQVSSQIATYKNQKLDIQIQIKEAQALYVNLQKELEKQPIELAAARVLNESPRYQKIITNLQEIDTQIAKESARFLEASPIIERLREQRQKLIPLLKQEGEQVERETAARIRELEGRNQSLAQTIDSLEQQIKQLSVVNRGYNEIEQESKIASDNLNQFLAKREALRIDAAQKQVPWQLLAPIGEPQPSSSNFKKNIILGTVVGMLLGLGVAIFVDKLTNIIYTSKEVKDLTKLPLLGVIPFEKELGEFAPAGNKVPFVQQVDLKNALGHKNQFQRYQTDTFFEIFRSLYTNIRLLGSDTRIQSFVISSAAPEDGKSTVAAHLAQAAAAMGQRVLLVDTNLRNPSVHNRVGLRNIQGLTDVISTDLDFNDVIERSPLEENLFVLTAGSIPPDPIRLLASQKMQDLMEQLQAAFDLVIYDAPPLLGVADAYLLAVHTNGIVLVTGLGKLKRPLLEQALEELKVAGAPILGVVANRSKESKPSQSMYYQRSSVQNYKVEDFDEDAEIGTPQSKQILTSLRKIKRR